MCFSGRGKRRRELAGLSAGGPFPSRCGPGLGSGDRLGGRRLFALATRAGRPGLATARPGGGTPGGALASPAHSVLSRAARGAQGPVGGGW